MGSIGGFVLQWYTRQMGTRNDPYLPNNPTQTLYTQSSALGPKYTYTRMSTWSLNEHASAWVENRPHFGKSIFGMQAQTVAKWVIMQIHAHFGEGKLYDLGVKVLKEGDYTNSTYFHMYLAAKYMRMPKF